jgi:hypothetical protein
MNELGVKQTIVASIILAISIVAGCYLISAKNDLGVHNGLESQQNDQGSVLLDIDEAAELLGLSTEELKRIIKTEQLHLDQNSSFSGAMLPYTVIDGTVYFERSTLLQWAQAITLEHRKYTDGTVHQ